MDENVAIVKVTQKQQHVTVSGAGGLRGLTGPKGEAGAALQITGSVDTYAELPTNLKPSDAGKAWFNQADGKLYVWSGTQFPADGQGSQFEGPQGPAGPTGFSPIATVSKTGSTTTISITDKEGTTTADVYDGDTLTDGIINGAANNATTVTGSKIALSTIGTPNIRKNAITTDTVADSSITTAKIADNAITTAKLASSSVVTAAIANSAVTSSKIDWSTYYGSSSIPVATTSVSTAYSIPLSLTRIGNIVIAQGTFVVDQGLPQNDEMDTGASIPSGFRPSSTIGTVWIPFSATQSLGSTLGAWSIYSGGVIKFSVAGASSGAQRFAYNSVYITNDPWPSS